MFGNFSYLVYMLLFCVPVIGLLWIRKYPLLYANRKTIFIVTLWGILWWLVVDPFSTLWQAWGYSSSKVIGIWIFGTPIEDLFYSIIVSFAIASAIVVFLDWKRRGKRRFLVG